MTEPSPATGSTSTPASGAPSTLGLDAVSWPIATPRLRLRPATVDDAPATWRFRRLDAVSHWLTAAPTSFDEYQATFCEPDRLTSTLVIEAGDHGVIGDLMLAIGDGWAQQEVADRARHTRADLGWALDPVHAGHGYATEAVRELIRLSFVELGIRRVVAECFTDNERSWHLMERLGMRREGHHVRESLHRSGTWLDSYTYALLAEEWQRTAAGGR